MQLTKYEPRDAQMLAVLLLLAKKEEIERLAEVFTGEGKSLIIAILSAIKVIGGDKVDIVTSSEVLAERDSKENFTEFYESLDITVGHNIDIDGYSDKPKKCYLNDVVFGTVHSFQADILRDEYKLKGTLNGRISDTVIVDEVDSMMIDAHNMSTLLAENIPGYEKLTYLM
jgi:preprotein translocase subunit SecA